MSAAGLRQPFDAAASAYDVQFSDRRLGRQLREAVWEILGRHFQPGQRVIDLGCGTGEDAIWLAQQGVEVVATDSSVAMLTIAAKKAESAGVLHRVHTAPLDLATPAAAPKLDYLAGRFHGAYSNFGALNCLSDWRPIAKFLARCIPPGGHVVLVVMGPCCLWEIMWQLAHGRPDRAFRRFRAGALAHAGEGSTVRIWYPSPRRLARDFTPHFRCVTTIGIGVLLPPSELAGLVDRHPVAFDYAARVERRLRRLFPFSWVGDHYLVELVRI